MNKKFIIFNITILFLIFAFLISPSIANAGWWGDFVESTTNSVKNAVDSGVNSVSNAIESGINSVNNAVESGVNSIVNAAETIWDGVKAFVVPVVIIGAIIITGGAAAALIAQIGLASLPAVFATIAGTVIIGSLWLGISFLAADCLFDKGNFSSNPIDPQIICHEKGGELALAVDVMVNNSDGPVRLQAPADFKAVWTIAGATESTQCNAVGDWSMNVTSSVGAVDFTGVKRGIYSFGIDCVEREKTVSDNVVVYVSAPQVNLFAPAKVMLPEGLVLIWESENATICEASGNWKGHKTLNGSEIIWNKTDISYLGEYNFILTCADDTGLSASSTRKVLVIPRPIRETTTTPGTIREIRPQ